MKVAVFGVGKFYMNRRDEFISLCVDDVVVCFFDNKACYAEKINNISVKKPSSVNSISFDYIIIMSSYYGEIYRQLCSLGVDEEKIVSWKQYRAMKTGGNIEEFKIKRNIKGKKILLVTNPIRYDGGSLVAVYAAISLCLRGYSVCIATEFIEVELKDELLRRGISVAINCDLPFFGTATKKWIESFAIVMVNLFPMIAAVGFISKIRPTLWWIHEASDAYSNVYKLTVDNYNRYADLQCFQNSYVVAVSNIAKKNFEKYYPNRVESILPYGIPDEANIIDDCCSKRKIVFATIGNISELKAQHIFARAARLVVESEAYDVEFLIIGHYEKNEYFYELKNLVNNVNEIKLIGEKTREELKKIFKEIDVVVCTSMEETMSLAITEGMMYGKVCVSSDSTGMAQYIIDGENGFIFERGNVNMLYEKMKYIIQYRDEMPKVKCNARHTYEKFFSIDSLGDKLDKELIKAERKFARNHGK